MRQAQSTFLACVRCFAPTAPVEGVAMLQSLEGQAVFECEWCGTLTLVRADENRRTAIWIGSLAAESSVRFAAL
jgi:predicted RNA-binding Zn-ribbon protein involved in translation (DUF1610 family)